MRKNKKNGFTLIELIMVMIILGILSAVAIPRYLETIQKSEKPAEDVKTEETSETEEKKEEAPAKEEPKEEEGSTEVSEDKPETKE